MKTLLMATAFNAALVYGALAADYGYEQPYPQTPPDIPQYQHREETVIRDQPVLAPQPRCHTMMVRDDILPWVWTQRDVCDIN